MILTINYEKVSELKNSMAFDPHPPLFFLNLLSFVVDLHWKIEYSDFHTFSPFPHTVCHQVTIIFEELRVLLHPI